MYGFGLWPRSSRPQRPSVSQTPPARTTNTGDDQESYAVYNALLGASSATVVIRDRTRAGVTCDDFSSSSDPRLRAAGDDFAKKNGTEHPLNESAFTLGRKVEMVSSAELDQDFSKGVSQGWTAFHLSHPRAHGYVDVSAVDSIPIRPLQLSIPVGTVGGFAVQEDLQPCRRRTEHGTRTQIAYVPGFLERVRKI